MTCYAINKVQLHRHHRENKDTLYIWYAGLSLPEGDMVDLAQEDVSITIDGKVYEFPAGSFKQQGDKMRYVYKTASRLKPQIVAIIDFKKSKWGLMLNRINSEFIDNSDGVDIALSIGDYQASETVDLKSKNKHKHHKILTFKRNPTISCEHRNHKHDDDNYNDNKHRSHHHKAKRGRKWERNWRRRG